MREYAIFQVFSEKAARVPYSPQVSDDVFLRIAKLAFEWGMSRRPPERAGSMIQIKAELPNTNLERILEILRNASWNPVYGDAPQDSEDGYAIRISRQYDQEDLDAADFLYVETVWGEWPVAGFVKRNGDRWVGNVDRVGIHSGLGWAQQIGYIDGAYNYFVSDFVKTRMVDEGLQGVRFHPLEWDDPSKAQGQFWEIDASASMPPCGLPVVNAGGILFYQEDGYSPVELRFQAVDVDMLGPFDVAWCREQIGNLTKDNWGRHVLVVSQKFRRAFIKLGLANLVLFYPVRLAR